MNTKKYVKANIVEINHLDLYQGGSIDKLDNVLKDIIEKEAPVTLNIIKERLRECFKIASIKENLLNIILERLDKLGFYYENELYDRVYYKTKDKVDMNYLRVDYKRDIYDYPFVELKNLVLNFDTKESDLYYDILHYFGLKRLTKKAEDYLKYIERNIK